MSMAVAAAVTLSPGVAAAQDECGNPNTNGSSPDGFLCTGAYPTGITYTTNGSLLLELKGLVSLPSQGLKVTGSAGDDVSILDINAAPGDLNFNVVGNAIDLLANGGDLLVFMRDDAGDGVPSIIGSVNGVLAVGSGAGVHSVTVDIDRGLIQGGSQYGIDAQHAGVGDITVAYGLSTVSGSRGIRADAFQGDIDIAGAGAVNATAGAGIAASTNQGDVSIIALGDIDALGSGIQVTSGGGEVHIESGDISVGANQLGIGVVHAGLGATSIMTFGDIDASAAGGTGIYFNGTGDLSIDTSGHSILSDDAGMDLTGINGGDIDISSGDITSLSGDGIHVSATGGNIAINTFGAIDADQNAITATTTGAGSINIVTSLGGPLTAGSGGASTVIDLSTQAGAIHAQLGEINDPTATYGLVATTVSGDIDVGFYGALSAGAKGAVLTSDSGKIFATVGLGGDVDGSFQSISMMSESGALNAVVLGNLSAPLQMTTGASSTAEVNLSILGGAVSSTVSSPVLITGANGAVTVTLGSGGSILNDANPTSAGMDITTNAGDVSVTTEVGTFIEGTTPNSTGILVTTQTGDITINSGGDITAGTAGILANSFSGNSKIVLGDGATIDPEDIGISSVTGGASAVTTGVGSTIAITDSGDGQAIGILASSGLLNDVGVPSVQVNLGRDSLITVNGGPGAEADGGFGVLAQNVGGGTGSVSVIAGGGFVIQMTGDGAAGIDANGPGDVSVVLGTGTIGIAAGDGLDGGGALGFSAGVFAASDGGGDVSVLSNASIIVDGVPGGVAAYGVRASTSGSGAIDITTGGFVLAGTTGIRADAVDGAVNIATGNLVQGAAGAGIGVITDSGAISISENGGALGVTGISATSVSGSIAIDSNMFAFGDDIGIAAATGANGAIDIAAGGAIGDSYAGISTLSNAGDTRVGATGSVGGGVFGVLSFSNSGDIAISTSGDVSGMAGAGIFATTGLAGSVAVNIQGGVNGFVAGSLGVGVQTDTGAISIQSGAGTQILGGNGGGVQAFSNTGAININLAGDVEVNGAVGVNAGSTGSVSVISTGVITGIDGGVGASSFGGGDVVVEVAGVNSDNGYGVAAQSVGGDLSVSVSDFINADTDGINVLSDSGDLSITSGGAISAGAFGIRAETNTGTLGITLGGGSVSGGDSGIRVSVNGGGGDLDIRSANTFISGAGTGISASQAGLGDLSISVDNGVVSAGDDGINAQILNAASTGDINILVDNGAAVVAGNVGVRAFNVGAGHATVTLGDGVLIDPDDYGVDIQSAGDATFTAGSGVTVLVGNTDNDATAIGVNVISTAVANAAPGDPRVEVNAGSNLTIAVDDGAGGEADGAIGINAVAFSNGTASVSLNLGVGLDMEIVGDNSVGINARADDGNIVLVTARGQISVTGGDGVDSAGTFGFSAGISGQTDVGNIRIDNAADIDVQNLLAGGSYGIRALSGAGLIKLANSGDILSTTTGIRASSTSGNIDVSNGGSINALLGNGIEAVSTSGGISVGLDVGTSIEAGQIGLLGSSAGTVQISAGSGSHIEAGIIGIAALSNTAAQVNLGNSVTIDPEDFGVLISSAGEATFTAGSDLKVIVGNTDGDGTAVGIAVLSGAAANVAPGNPAVELAIGTDFTLGIDDGFAGGDADGATGILANANNAGSTAGVDIGIGRNLVISMFGDNSMGIAANTTGGGIAVRTGTGLISLEADGTDTVGNFNFAAGIAARSGSGSILVDTMASISVQNTTSAAYGILAETGGAGTINVISGGQISTSDIGIRAASIGSGAISVDSNASIAADHGGIFVVSAAGSILIDQAAGTTVSAGNDGIFATVVNGAGNIDIVNRATTNANQMAGVASGILARHTGSGDIFVNNSGTILGTAFVGINAVSAGPGTGDVSVLNTGAIGTNVAPAGSVGINASISNAANLSTVSLTSSGPVFGAARGLLATTAGTGSVTVVNNGVVGAGGIGIEAIASGGALSVTTSAAGTVTGNQTGIRTANTGAGTTSITTGATVFASPSTGLAGINASTTGAGALSVTTQSVVASAGNAVRTASNGGAVTVNLGTGLPAVASVVGGGQGATSWVVDLANTGAGVSTVNVGSNTILRSADAGESGFDDLVIRGVGGSAVINNAGQLHGRVNFAGLTGNLAFNNSSAFSWHTTGLSVFSPGADVITNTATGSIFTNAGGAVTTWDFGAGNDIFNNAGLLVVGEQTTAASTLAFAALERWNNSGRVMFGLSGTALDGLANDRILAPGALFTGSAGSLLVMDVNLGATAQTGCGALTAADCLDLTGGSTAGVTGILVHDIAGAMEGALNTTGIVLVDVSGAGTTGAGHFVLDPGSSFWRADASADGILDKGLFVYDLVLNANKQHMLVGAPDSEAFEFPTVGEATQSLWYSSVGNWFERQAGIEGHLDTVASPGVWMKLSTVDQDRTTSGSFNVSGLSVLYDTSHEQQTQVVTLGADLASGETAGGTRWLAGAMVGYVDSRLDFDNSTTAIQFSGMTFGAYGTLAHGPAFVHGLVAGEQVDMAYDAPSLAAAGNIMDGQVHSWGFQVEGGYTIATGQRTFLEPLFSVARVTTSIDGLTVPGATVEWDDQDSLRLSLGGRWGALATFDAVDARFSLTARLWDELAAENETIIQVGASTVKTLDDFTGTFGELSGTVDLDSRRSAFSAFLSAGVKWNDDYEATEASAGVRYRW